MRCLADLCFSVHMAILCPGDLLSSSEKANSCRPVTSLCCVSGFVSHADIRLAQVYCDGNSDNSGGSNVTIAGGTFTDNEALEHGGAIVAWGSNDGEPTSMTVTVTGGVFANNKAA